MKKLLIILLLMPVAMPVIIYAQNNGPLVNIVTSPDKPLAANAWTFTLYIDYPDPDGVSVIAPPFDEALSLERIVKYPRVTGSKVQTAVEYRFIPARSGRFTLEEFTVICPDGVTETSPYILDITAQDGEQRTVTLRLNWEAKLLERNAAAQITAGEKILLTLRATDADSRLPPPEFFFPEVPPKALLSLSPVAEEERKSGVAAKFTLIPLAAEDFRLEARTLQQENIRFNIPALQINAGPVNAQNTSRINSQNIYADADADADAYAYAPDALKAGQIQSEYSSDNTNFLQRFLPLLSIIILILVIITPFICLTLFKRGK